MLFLHDGARVEGRQQDVERQGLTSPEECRDIDISIYRNLKRYVDEVEKELGKAIRFCDAKAGPTGVDFDFCCKHFPAVWVNRSDLHSVQSAEALLAHEVMHIQLVFIEGYPVVNPLHSASKSAGRAVVQMRNVLQDFVVEDRLLKLGFDRSADFEDMVDFTVKRQRQGPHYIEPSADPQHRELIEAFHCARLYLSRYAERRHKDRLRKAYKHSRAFPWAYAKHIIGVVQRTSDILEPEGQHRTVHRVGITFDLDKAYVIKVARNLSSFDEVS